MHKFSKKAEMRGDLTRLLNRLKVFWHCLQYLAFKCLFDNTRCFSIVLWSILLDLEQ